MRSHPSEKTLNVGLGATQFLTNYLHGKIERVCERPMESITIKLNKIEDELKQLISTFAASI